MVIGPWADPSIEFGNLGMLLEINGAARQIGSTAAILGHPIFSLVAEASLVAERGERLEAGDLVMAGGATAAGAVAAGDYVELSVERLGAVSFVIAD